MEGLGINLGYLIVQVFNFLVVVVVLSRFVFRPILNMLETRKQTIEQGLEDARTANEAKAQAEEQAAKILAEAKHRAREETRHAAEKAEQLVLEIKAEAEKDIAKMRDAAREEAEQARTQALGELRGEVASLAIAAAQKLIGESLDDKRQRALIDAFFSGIEGKKILVLDQVDLEGVSAVITSALPLSEKEQNSIRERLLAELDEGAQIEFNVKPAILGGLVVQVNDKVLDGSVAGKLHQLSQHLG